MTTRAVDPEQEQVHSVTRYEWRVVREIMTRPQPITIPMIVLLALIPLYLVIGEMMTAAQAHVPEIALDRAIPLSAAWSAVYGSLFLAAILPAFVVHEKRHFHRTIVAFVAIWAVSLVCFVVYPTVSSRPPLKTLTGDGFSDWLLRTIYSTDGRYNCWPSLHVAQCFLAAFTCYHMHRGVGAVAVVWALLVAVSTLFTKQHYVLDAVTGAAMAYVAYVIFIRGLPREAIPERDRRYAPLLALGAVGTYGVIVAIFAILFLAGAQP